MNYAYTQAIMPIHHMARLTRQLSDTPWSPLAKTLGGRAFHAGLELLERMTAHYDAPPWNLNCTKIDGETVRIKEHIALKKPYCNLLNFKRSKTLNSQQTVLMLAPLSGHFATLLRGTVDTFLPDHNVYISDWRNARDVSISEGRFTFDDYVRYIIEFIQFLGPNTHVIAVCQPCVPALVANAVMSMTGDHCTPKTLTLMGGPIDARINPTEVNDYASGKDIEWFESNVICQVPSHFNGAGQQVYPGFIQLAGFLSMNLDNHITKHFKFYQDLIKGDGDSAEAHRAFYNEYLAVMDMPADYYLDTLRKVFLDFKLPKGTMTYQDQVIDLSSITKSALLTVEGELDDITGIGQTRAALDLCTSLPSSMKSHYEQKGVGHYGIFNGRTFRQSVAPRIKAFIAKHAQ